MFSRDDLAGYAVSIAIAVLGYYLSTLHASFDPLVIAIIAGMLVGNMISARDAFKKGIESSIRIFMPVGIAFYGSQLVFKELSFGLVSTIFLVFLTLFCLTLLLSAVFNLDRKLAILLASGLAVCGASAIAVISPLIGARREDTSVSLISIVVLGLSGMIFYPLATDIVPISLSGFSFLAGTTLPMLGQVKVAAAKFSPKCLEPAIDIKLIRISFLLFLATIAVFLSGREKRGFSMPWFMVVFVILAVAANTVKILSPITGFLKGASSFFLSAGLAAIGFSVDIDAVVQKGTAPLGVIFVAWITTILLIFLVRNLF